LAIETGEDIMRKIPIGQVIKIKIKVDRI